MDAGLFDQLVATVRDTAGSADPLDRLSAAAVISRGVADVADALLGHFVEECRRHGCSWADVGAAMGVTKQAAQKRFAEASLSRFTPRARRVLEAADAVAEAQGASVVRLDHLLLAVFREPDTIGAKVLAELGIGEAALRAELGRRAFEPGVRLADETRPDAELVSTALALGHNYIGTEHMLLAPFRRPDSVGAQALVALGASEDAVRERVLRALSPSR
jgi:hypothetical protein